MKLSHREFERIVKEAVEGLPKPIRDKLQRTVFVIQDDMTEELRREFGEELLGLYRGHNLRERSEGEPLFPDEITLFKHPIEDEADDRAHLIEIIQDTVLHEVGHFLGLEEDDLEEMGLG